jgi:nucleoside-diphosphate-sugar epimerase
VKVAVTGGAGFIGSNLVDALVERGDDVLVIDNLVSGKREYLNPAADLATLDITVDSDGLLSALRGRDVVFHTAALTRIQRTIDDPLNSHATNVTGTLRVLKAADDAGVRRVVYSSSSSVYGDQPVLPLTEDMVPNPLNPYACQKFMGELYARDFHRTFGLQTVCLRYFNVYGPRQVMEGAYRLVIGIFMDQRRNGEPLTIHGDGEQTRDFTWVGDVVRANILAAESDRVGAGEPINVGAGEEVTINHIAELFGGPVVHTPPRGFDERFKRASVERAREILGWQPTVTVDEGIRRLLAPAQMTEVSPLDQSAHSIGLVRSTDW